MRIYEQFSYLAKKTMRVMEFAHQQYFHNAVLPLVTYHKCHTTLDFLTNEFNDKLQIAVWITTRGQIKPVVNTNIYLHCIKCS
ncbi:hypothetical protein XELAEV_18008036mg [Xenopus laevis]|uniref:Uncharacterized protein n=1 Tax=Xenopus laevis TaxID=8355 RepID=A0A974I599_XENLA|nr:hypothetical protein XELAEV_18008036mg [Xenopus laevis]